MQRPGGFLEYHNLNRDCRFSSSDSCPPSQVIARFHSTIHHNHPHKSYVCLSLYCFPGRCVLCVFDEGPHLTPTKPYPDRRRRWLHKLRKEQAVRSKSAEARHTYEKRSGQQNWRAQFTDHRSLPPSRRHIYQLTARSPGKYRIPACPPHPPSSLPLGLGSQSTSLHGFASPARMFGQMGARCCPCTM